MHQPIKDRLEGYLSGTEGSQSVREIEAHLASCGECRRTVERMRRQSELLKLLRPPEELDPAPGFYARVMDRIESQRALSVWSALLEPAFGRRVAYVSAVLVLLLGTLIITGTNRPEPMAGDYAYSPEAILAEKPVSPYIGDDVQHDRDVVLVNLATYEY